MPAACAKPEVETDAARRDRIAPGTEGRPRATPRRVEEPPALVMVLAPVVGLLLWVGLIALVL